MPEVIFPGPEGRLEGRYHPQKEKDAPIAIILHPHPQFGGTMNNRVVYNLHYAFLNMGFTVLRFNFRGVGRSQGEYDQGIGELSDAASRARLPAIDEPEFQALLGRGLFLWRLDRHAAFDAPPRDHRLHLCLARPPTCTTFRSSRPARPRV